MSKLYDAITKIEAAHDKKESVPEFSGRKKPPYLIIGLTLIVIAVLGTTAFIITDKISAVNKNGIYNKPQRQNIHIVKTGKILPHLKTIKNRVVLTEKSAKIDRKTTEKIAVSGTLSKKPSKKLLIAKIKKRIEKKPKKRIRIVAVVKKSLQKSDNKAVVSHNSINQMMLFRDIKSNDNRVAVGAYKKLIKKYPEKVELYNNLAALYIKKGSYRNALRILNRIPTENDTDVKLNMSIVYIKLGEYKKAQVLMKNLFLKNNKQQMTAIKINNFLRNIRYEKKNEIIK